MILIQDMFKATIYRYVFPNDVLLLNIDMYLLIVSIYRYVYLSYLLVYNLGLFF